MDVATLKAAPNNYGYRGEFLCNVITVSQIVKITSRYESTEETWAKTFHNGKEKKLAQMTTRPTKGTTVSRISGLEVGADQKLAGGGAPGGAGRRGGAGHLKKKLFFFFKTYFKDIKGRNKNYNRETRSQAARSTP